MYTSQKRRCTRRRPKTLGSLGVYELAAVLSKVQRAASKSTHRSRRPGRQPTRLATRKKVYVCIRVHRSANRGTDEEFLHSEHTHTHTRTGPPTGQYTARLNLLRRIKTSNFFTVTLTVEFQKEILANDSILSIHFGEIGKTKIRLKFYETFSLHFVEKRVQDIRDIIPFFETFY